MAATASWLCASSVLNNYREGRSRTLVAGAGQGIAGVSVAIMEEAWEIP